MQAPLPRQMHLSVAASKQKMSQLQKSRQGSKKGDSSDQSPFHEVRKRGIDKEVVSF